MKIYLLFAMFCLTVTYTSALGQQTEADRIRLERENAAQQQRINEFENQTKGQADNLRKSNEDAKLYPDAPILYKKPRVSRKEIKRIKAALSPSSEDFSRFGNFLQQPKTGLFRLMPNFGCNQKYLVRVGDDCQNSMPLGEFYSFRRKDYSDADFFDLTLRDERLTTGGFLSQGILVLLGNIPLEDISLASNGVRFLSDFKPKTEISEVKKQFREIAQGIDHNGFRYGKSERVFLDTTYGMRIVTYRSENKVFHPDVKGEEKFWKAQADKRVDLTLAFRVTRKDEDGSLIILWKELNRQDAPRINFSKGEKLTDISQ
jgi:hypothetical protein